MNNVKKPLSDQEPDKGFLTKFLCSECHRTFKRPATGMTIRRCSHCARETVIRVSHRFRPPRLRDKKSWAVIDYLLENGFNFDRIYVPLKGTPQIKSSVPYPTDMRTAKTFVRLYKGYATSLPMKNRFQKWYTR